MLCSLIQFRAPNNSCQFSDRPTNWRLPAGKDTAGQTLRCVTVCCKIIWHNRQAGGGRGVPRRQRNLSIGVVVVARTGWMAINGNNFAHKVHISQRLIIHHFASASGRSLEWQRRYHTFHMEGLHFLSCERLYLASGYNSSRNSSFKELHGFFIPQYFCYILLILCVFMFQFDQCRGANYSFFLFFFFL